MASSLQAAPLPTSRKRKGPISPPLAAAPAKTIMKVKAAPCRSATPPSLQGGVLRDSVILESSIPTAARMGTQHVSEMELRPIAPGPYDAPLSFHQPSARDLAPKKRKRSSSVLQGKQQQQQEQQQQQQSTAGLRGRGSENRMPSHQIKTSFRSTKALTAARPELRTQGLKAHTPQVLVTSR